MSNNKTTVLFVTTSLLIGFFTGYVFQQNKINELFIQTLSYQTQIEEKIETIRHINHTIIKNIKTLVKLQQNQTALRKEIYELNLKNKYLETQKERLSSDLTQLEEEYEELNSKLDELTGKYIMLLNESPYQPGSLVDLSTFKFNDDYNILSVSHAMMRCEFNGLEQDHHDIYMYRDFGSGYLNDFVHHFEFNITELDVDSPSVNKLSLISYTNERGDVKGLKAQGVEALFLKIRRVDQEYVIQLQETTDTNAFNTDTSKLELNEEYYTSLTKHGSYVRLSIYEDPERTSMITSASLPLHDAWSYRYITLANSLGYNDSDNGNSGYIENLEIN